MPTRSTLFTTMIFKTFYSELMLNTGKFEQALFCAEQAFDIGLKNKVLLNLPKIADILAFIYNQILSSGQPPEIQQTYKNKFLKLQQIMAELTRTEQTNQ